MRPSLSLTTPAQLDPAESSSETHAKVVARLASTASKSNWGAAGYTRWVNRPLGRQVAAFAFRRGVTPNQLTAVNAAIIFPVLILIAVIPPAGLWNVIAALLLMAGYVLDSADGQLARLRGGGSKAGEWLDHVVDAVKTALVHGALAVVWYRFYEFQSATWLLIPLAFGVVHSTYFFSLMLADDLRHLAKVERGGIAAGFSRKGRGVLRSMLMLPNDWGVLCIALMLLPFQWPFVTVYALLLAANTGFLFIGWVRWYRELVTL